MTGQVFRKSDGDYIELKIIYKVAEFTISYLYILIDKDEKTVSRSSIEKRSLKTFKRENKEQHYKFLKEIRESEFAKFMLLHK